MFYLKTDEGNEAIYYEYVYVIQIEHHSNKKNIEFNQFFKENILYVVYLVTKNYTIQYN